MCTFVLCVLDHGTNVDALPTTETGPRLRPVPNPHQACGLPAFTTGVGCDCGTELGSARRGTDDAEAELEKAAAKKRRAGWSEARVARWIDDRRRGLAKRERTREFAALHGTTREAAAWVEWLRAALDSERCVRIGLLIHDFDGRLDSERIDLERETRWRVAEVGETTLRELDHDVLHWFE